MCQLKIKSEALNLMSKQLELCNKEKLEYKRLIDTLYDKNLSLKKSLYFKQNQVDAEDENFFQLNSMPLVGMKNMSSSSNNHSDKSKNNKYLNPISVSPNSSTTALFSDIDSEDYMKILKDLIKTLQKEKHDLIQKYEDTKQELNDAKSDLRLLREQIVRERVGSVNEGLTTTVKVDINSVNLITPPNHHNKQSRMTSSMSYMSSLSASAESSSNLSIREGLIKEIESLKESKSQIENDLKLVLCQKEELEIERDSFKDRYLKLNEFLISTGSSSQPIDMNNNPDSVPEINYQKLDVSQIRLNIDELVSQNKYLSESNQHLKEELESSKSQCKKYKSLIQSNNSAPSIESHHSSNSNNSIKLNSALNNISSEINLINKMKIKNLLKSADDFIQNYHSTQENQSQNAIIELINELKLVIESLVESINDKLTANQHQRKVNKMLATRIQDLEKQINEYSKMTSTTNVEDTPLTPTNCGFVKQQSPFAALSSTLVLKEPLIPLTVSNSQNDLEQSEIQMTEAKPKFLNESLIKFDNDKSNHN